MIKRFNFTGRRRISRGKIKIKVFEGKPLTFNAGLDLNGPAFPGYAVVFLEAMCAGSNVIQRFDCGTVEQLRQPSGWALTEVEGDNVFFALKVVDSTNNLGRILGLAEGVRPERAGKPVDVGRQGILPIEAKDLDQELWRIHFGDQHVSLLINDRIQGMKDVVRSGGWFMAAVYPAIVRQILLRAIAENVDPEEVDDRWPHAWLRFGLSLHPHGEKPPNSEDAEEVIDWVEEVAQEFCKKHSLRDKFAQSNSGDAGGEP